MASSPTPEEEQAAEEAARGSLAAAESFFRASMQGRDGSGGVRPGFEIFFDDAEEPGPEAPPQQQTAVKWHASAVTADPRPRHRPVAAEWFGGSDGVDEYRVVREVELRAGLESAAAVLCVVDGGVMVRSYGTKTADDGHEHVKVTAGGATGWLAIRGPGNVLFLERLPGRPAPTSPGTQPAEVSTTPRSVAPMVLHALQTKAAQALEGGDMDAHQLYCEQIIALKSSPELKTAQRRWPVEVTVYELGVLKDKLGANFGAFHTAVVVAVGETVILLTTPLHPY